MTAAERWCMENDVAIIPTPPYKHNRTIEAMMNVVLHQMNVLLIAAYLSEIFWARAFLVAIFLINRRSSFRSRLPALRNGLITPFQAFHGFKPDLSGVFPFGATCYVRLPGVKASHLRSLAYQGLYIGQARRGWNVLRLSDMKVFTVWHMKADRNLNNRPALFAQRRDLVNTQAALISPDARQIWSTFEALFRNYGPEENAMSQLVMDPLTNLPIKYEPVDLSGEEIGLQPIPTATASSGSSDRNVTSSTIPSQTHVQHSSSRPTPVAPDHVNLSRPHQGFGLPPPRTYIRYNPSRHALSPVEKSQLRNLPHDTAISFVANPKRVGSKSFARYDRYKHGKTLGECYKAGMTSDDLQNDFERKFCTFDSNSHQVDIKSLFTEVAETIPEDPGSVSPLLDTPGVESLLGRISSQVSSSSLSADAPSFSPSSSHASSPASAIQPSNASDSAPDNKNSTPVYEFGTSPADFMERTAILLLKNWENFRSFDEMEDQIRATEGRSPSSSHNSAVSMLKELILTTDFQHLCADLCSISSSERIIPPKSPKEALKNPDKERRTDWREKLRAEWFRMFEKFGALEPVDFDEMLDADGQQVRGDAISNMKFLFEVKYHVTGELNRTKTRLVATQTTRRFREGNVFSPTAMLDSVRILLQLTVSYDLWGFTLDLAGAYLFAPPDRTSYLRAPPGLNLILDDTEFPRTKTNRHAKFFRARKAVYGLQSSCKAFWQHYAKWLSDHGFQQSCVDACVWYRFASADDFVIILTHSDDNLVVGKGKACKEELMDAWERDFQQSPDSGGVDSFTSFVGLQIDRRDDCLYISCPGIIDKLPALAGPCPNSCSSPISDNHGCDKPVSSTNPAYTGPDLRKPLGVILFVALSCRPDVCHAAVWLSTYVGRGQLTKNVATQVNRLAWYIVTTKETHRLCYRKSDGILRALLDASFANDAETFRSWYGFCCTIGTNTGVISYRSALARSVVSSTRDAELLAALHCTYRVFAHRLFLAEIGLQQPDATPTGSDAMAVVQGVSVRVVHRDSRWSAIRFACIKQAIEDNLIAFYHLLGEHNASDLFTKLYGGLLLQKNSMYLLGTPTTMESDLACIDQFDQDDILMIRYDDSKITAATVVPQSELTPSVAALFK